MESFEFPGVWWIPTDPDKTKFYGPLKFDPKNGGKLALTFDEDGESHEILGSRERLPIPIIHGKMDGRKVTLINCTKTEPGWQGRDNARDAYTQTATVWTDTVFLGVHFNSLEDIEFQWMSVSYTHLNTWLGIERLAGFENGRPVMKPFDGVGVPVRSDLNIFLYRAPYEEVGENQSPYPVVLIAEIAPKNSMPFRSHTNRDEHDDGAFFSYIDRYLRDFMNLVTGAPNYPFNIAAVSPYDSKQLVKVFYRIPSYDPQAQRRVEVSMTVPYDTIQSTFADCLTTWIENSSAWWSACDLFFRRYYLSNIDIETQFMFLMQAVEAYHRRKSGDTYLECEDFAPLAELLNAEIEKQVQTINVKSWADGKVDPVNVNSLKQSLLNSVKYGNEYSLRRRLKHIREVVLCDNLELVDGLLENPKVFINRATETRNFLAHQLAERNSDVLGPSEYPEYERKLRLLLRLCLLIEMGLEPSAINNQAELHRLKRARPVP